MTNNVTWEPRAEQYLDTILAKALVLVQIHFGPEARNSGKKKAHEHNFFFHPVALGTTPGLLLILHNGSPVSPWDNAGEKGRRKEFWWR